jgi:hypothetical protein
MVLAFFQGTGGRKFITTFTTALAVVPVAYLLCGLFMSKLLDRFVYLSFHLTSGEHGMDGIEGRSLIISYPVWKTVKICSSSIHKSRLLHRLTRRNHSVRF